MNTNGLSHWDLSAFAKVLEDLDERGLQVEGAIFVEDTGSMTVTFDGNRNVAVSLEGIE